MLEASRGAWVGWSGSKEEPPALVSGLSLDLRAVPLSPRLVTAYYHGFSNQTLWPLFHDLVHQPIINRSWWEAYRWANETTRVLCSFPSFVHWPSVSSSCSTRGV